MAYRSVKEHNMHRVSQYLYAQEDICSRQDIAYALHLSFPTVNQNVNALIERGLAAEVGVLESTGGRKAAGIKFIHNAKYAIGIDVTRYHVILVVCNLFGDIIYTNRLSLTFTKDREYFHTLGDLVDTAIHKSGIDPNRILGVGIALPAIISENRSLLSYSTVLGSSGITHQDFSEYINYPCTLCNDAKAAATAEIWNHDFEEDLVYLSLNNSVGGAIIRGNTVLLGENQRSAEFGHMKLFPGGRQCYCGQRGCMDAYCNAMVLSDLEHGDLDRFFEKLNAGSHRHMERWTAYLQDLVIAINNLRMVFDCDVIVGGYVGANIGGYLRDLRRMAKELNTFETYGDYVRACRNQREATAVGAALTYLKPFLESI